MVPLADHLNHANVNVSMICCEETTLKDPANSLEIDHKDFAPGKRLTETCEMPKLTYRSRLEKYEKANPKAGLKVANIWELNKVLNEYKSSEDEEDYSENEQSDSEEDEAEEEEEPEKPLSSYYYLLKTGARGSCKAGKQLFNCYGNYSNRQLLLYYGFAMEGNAYDSLRVRLWNPAFGGRMGLISLEDLVEKRYTEELAAAKLDDVTQIFRLKRNKVNFALLTYFRQEVLKELAKDPTTMQLASSILQASPTTELVEIPVVERVLALLSQVEAQRFRTSLDSDTSIDPDSVPVRFRYAVRFRTSQKRIFRSQLALMTLLSSILRRMQDGTDLTEAHMTQGTLEELYPLMAYLRALQVNNSRWTQAKSPRD